MNTLFLTQRQPRRLNTVVKQEHCSRYLQFFLSKLGFVEIISINLLINDEREHFQIQPANQVENYLTTANQTYPTEIRC